MGKPPQMPPPVTQPRHASSASAISKTASTVRDNSSDTVAPGSPPASAEDLLGLVAELTEDPVCEDGVILEDRLEEVLRRLWTGTARRSKDWVAAWQAMVIPVELQAQAI